MKSAVMCLMCLVVASVESKTIGLPGQYYRVLDSFENGVWDTSLEWIPQGGYTGGAVNVKSGGAMNSPSPYMMMKADSSEEAYYMLGDFNLATTRSRPQKVADLTRLLNSGTMDLSDEYMLRTVMNNPERFRNHPYVVDNSGEVHFLPPGSSSSSSAAGGGYMPQGTGVQQVKK